MPSPSRHRAMHEVNVRTPVPYRAPLCLRQPPFKGGQGGAGRRRTFVKPLHDSAGEFVKVRKGAGLKSLIFPKTNKRPP